MSPPKRQQDGRHSLEKSSNTTIAKVLNRNIMSDSVFKSFRKELWPKLRPLVLQYGGPTVFAVLLLKHFGSRGKGKGSTMLSSLLMALKSRTLRNMVVTASILTYAAKRVFGFKTGRVFPSFFILVWTMVYKYRVVETPQVWFRRTYWNTHIVEKARIAQEAFYPTVWAFNRHAQTITCYLLSNLEWLWAEQITYTRETIPCFDFPNKQFIDWASIDNRKKGRNVGLGALGKRNDDISTAEYDDEDDRIAVLPQSQVGSGSSGTHWDTPVVLCIHGLGDDKDIPYLRRFARMCLRHGWRLAVWSYWRFDFEESRDLHLVVQHIQKQSPHAPIVAVAWSAGVYSLTRYLEKIGRDTPLVAAVCQSGCLDFAQAVKDVTENENATYPLFLLGQAHVCIKRHVENDRNIVDKEPFYALLRKERRTMPLYNQFLCLLPRPKVKDERGLGHEGSIGTVGTWEERVKTASHYNYSAIDSVNRIEVTTLLLHADDDPVVSSEHIDWQKIESNRNIIVAHTKRGGHCAWFEGWMPFGDTWGDRVTTNFISTVLESHSQTHFIVELVNRALANNDDARDTLASSGFPTSPVSNGTSPTKKRDSATMRSSRRSREYGLPQVMARITSAADLASMASPTLGVAQGHTMMVRNDSFSKTLQ